jgi:hypothetical protein
MHTHATRFLLWSTSSRVLVVRLEVTTRILRARFRHALIPGPVLVPLRSLRLERRHDFADNGPCVPLDGYAAVTMHTAVPTDVGCVCGGAGWGMALPMV